jgi:AcrR family transcriptional regulator
MGSKHSVTQSRLYENTRTLIMKKGLRGWNMGELARLCGVSKRTLYTFIESKEALIANAIWDSIDLNQERLLSLTNEGTPFLSRLSAVARLLPECIFAQSELYREVFIAYPAVEEGVYKRRALFLSRFSGFIEEGRTGGFLRADLDASALLGWIQAIVLWGLRAERCETVLQGIAALLRGVLSADAKWEVS